MKGNRPRDVFGGKEKQEVPKEKQTAKLLWRPPEEGWIKINVDGSYVERTGQASAGVIIRDHNAHVLVSAWKHLFHCFSAEEAELFARREGLLLAHHWCNGSVIMESDCSSCLDALVGINRSIHASLVQDVKMIMTILQNVRLVKVTREQNRVAYELAQYAVFGTPLGLGSALSCIEHVVLLDCNITLSCLMKKKFSKKMDCASKPRVCYYFCCSNQKPAPLCYDMERECQVACPHELFGFWPSSEVGFGEMARIQKAHPSL